MSFQSDLLSTIILPYPSTEIVKLPLFQQIPELEICRGVEQNPLHHAYDVLGHLFSTLDNIVVKNPMLRLAALLHDIAKPGLKVIKNGAIHFPGQELASGAMARTILNRLGFDSASIAYVCKLIENHKVDFRLKDPEQIKTLYMEQGEDFLNDLMKLRLADMLGSGKATSYSLKILTFQKLLKDLIMEKSLKQLPIQKSKTLYCLPIQH